VADSLARAAEELRGSGSPVDPGGPARARAAASAPAHAPVPPQPPALVQGPAGVGGTGPAGLDDEAGVEDPSPEGSAPERGAQLTRAVFLAVVPLLIGGLYLWQVLKLPELGRQVVVSPRAWPLLIAGAMVLFATLITVGIVLRRWGLADDGEDEHLQRNDVLGVLLALLVLAVTFEWLGFLLSSFLLVGTLSTMTSPDRWRRNVLTAAGFAVVSQVLFDQLLGVHLPQGLLWIPTW